MACPSCRCLVVYTPSLSQAGACPACGNLIQLSRAKAPVEPRRELQVEPELCAPSSNSKKLFLRLEIEDLVRGGSAHATLAYVAVAALVFLVFFLFKREHGPAEPDAGVAAVAPNFSSEGDDPPAITEEFLEEAGASHAPAVIQSGVGSNWEHFRAVDEENGGTRRPGSY